MQAQYPSAARRSLHLSHCTGSPVPQHSALFCCTTGHFAALCSCRLSSSASLQQQQQREQTKQQQSGIYPGQYMPAHGTHTLLWRSSTQLCQPSPATLLLYTGLARHCCQKQQQLLAAHLSTVPSLQDRYLSNSSSTVTWAPLLVAIVSTVYQTCYQQLAAAPLRCQAKLQQQ